jgi:hypothetical protein
MLAAVWRIGGRREDGRVQTEGAAGCRAEYSVGLLRKEAKKGTFNVVEVAGDGSVTRALGAATPERVLAARSAGRSLDKEAGSRMYLAL